VVNTVRDEARQFQPVALVASIVDPEIPVVTICDLGIVRGVEVDGLQVTVTVTPTYSGCPAMDVITTDIRNVLEQHGYQARVETVYAPAWTTDDISPRGRARLLDHGIAPPTPIQKVACPRCGHNPVDVISEFGSTACKALMVCPACREPFHMFKELR
jgi:ring-1,2-phenylacetyl-CoA epoxidase subunit PaaD